MKSLRWFTCLAGALVALGLTVAFADQAAETPASPPSPAPEVAPAAPAEPAPESPLRRLDEPSAAPAASAESAPAAAPEEEEDEADRDHGSSSAPVVVFGGDALLAADNRASEVVAIFGNAVADGRVRDGVVAIMGDATLNGEAKEVVAVLGNVTVNGQVRGEVVAVLGQVQLGPRAVVEGEVVSVGGGVIRAPGAVVHNGVQEIGFMKGHLPRLDGLKAWLRHCGLLGRPLGFGENLGWAWLAAGCFLGFYLLLSLAFGPAVVKCAEILEERPGYTILASLLTMLLTPLLAILLAVTGIGPLALGFAGFFGTLFGKAAFLTWMGRRFTRPMGIGLPVVATLIGGVLLTLFYLVPYFGIIMWKLSNMLGLGMVVYTLILTVRRERPPAPAMAAASVPTGAPVPPAPSAAPAAPASSFVAEPAVPPAGGFVVTPPAPAASVPPLPFSPPPMQLSTLPRAGFWIRAAAAALDAVLIGIAAGLIDFVGDYFVLMYAVYCVAFWALKGTTVGGVICGLKVVRIDDRPIDWPVAVVRGLGGFLSLAIGGLGFIWVVFDDARQSWHDKIAGTTIVHMPKGTALL